MLKSVIALSVALGFAVPAVAATANIGAVQMATKKKVIKKEEHKEEGGNAEDTEKKEEHIEKTEHKE